MTASPSPLRGEIWLASLGAARPGEPGKNRPVVIVSPADLLAGVEDELVAVVPLSASRSPSRLRPTVGPEAGIDKESVAVCRAVRSVASRRLLRPLGAVAPSTLAEIGECLRLILGLDLERD